MLFSHDSKPGTEFSNNTSNNKIVNFSLKSLGVARLYWPE